MVSLDRHAAATFGLTGKLNLLPGWPAARYGHCVDDPGLRRCRPRGLDRSPGRSYSLVHHETVVRVNRDGERATRWRTRRGIHDTRRERSKSSSVAQLNCVDVVAHHVAGTRVVCFNPVLPVRGCRCVGIFGNDIYCRAAGREGRIQRFLCAVNAGNSGSTYRWLCFAVAHERRASRSHIGL